MKEIGIIFPTRYYINKVLFLAYPSNPIQNLTDITRSYRHKMCFFFIYIIKPAYVYEFNKFQSQRVILPQSMLPRNIKIFHHIRIT